VGFHGRSLAEARAAGEAQKFAGTNGSRFGNDPRRHELHRSDGSGFNAVKQPDENEWSRAGDLVIY
jgi:hypothetical protein